MMAPLPRPSMWRPTSVQAKNTLFRSVSITVSQSLGRELLGRLEHGDALAVDQHVDVAVVGQTWRRRGRAAPSRSLTSAA